MLDPAMIQHSTVLQHRGESSRSTRAVLGAGHTSTNLTHIWEGYFAQERAKTFLVTSRHDGHGMDPPQKNYLAGHILD